MGKILTTDQLKKHGFSLARRYPFYGQVEEVLEHLLSIALRFGACGQPYFLNQKVAGSIPSWLKS